VRNAFFSAFVGFYLTFSQGCVCNFTEVDFDATTEISKAEEPEDVPEGSVKDAPEE